MSYVARVLVKTLMVPVFLVLAIPALILFIFDPEKNKIRLLLEK